MNDCTYRDGSKTDEQILKESVSVIGTIRNVIDPDSQARKKQNYEQMLQHQKKLEDDYGQKILDASEAQERQKSWSLKGVAAEEIHY